MNHAAMRAACRSAEGADIAIDLISRADRRRVHGAQSDPQRTSAPLASANGAEVRDRDGQRERYGATAVLNPSIVRRTTSAGSVSQISWLSSSTSMSPA